ncbi:MAG: 4-phosphoerythronate dehydrogenase [Gammaproteobacteria bacterium]
MRIVADENIPGLEAWCAGLGEITTVPGRALSRAMLRDADVLLVRSVTRVGPELLEGTPVRFVGTATAGVDHVDVPSLQARGIRFAAAPGCNAVAVAEYVLACSLRYARDIGRALADLRVGIVGAGHVGTAVAHLLTALGVRWVAHDPPRALRDSGFAGVPRDQVLASDIVTLHVPLVDEGPHPTRHLVGAPEIAALAPRALLVNAARGGVLDEAAWLAHAGSRQLAVDCWEGEPRILPALRAVALVASPHVAGHTVDARLRATGMLAHALTAWLGLAAPPAPPPPASVALDWRARPRWEEIVRACCDPDSFTAAMQAMPEGDSGPHFDRLRARFGVRREFAAHVVRGMPRDDPARARLQALGFECDA